METKVLSTKKFEKIAEAKTLDSKIKILIVEDDANDVELLQYELKKAKLNFTTDCVQTEKDYENALLNCEYDVILSDYNLPSFDGLSAFKIRKKMAQHIPFIFVTGTIGEENSIELIKNGVTDFVLKDKLFTLPTKIERALKESKEKQEKFKIMQKLIRSESRLARGQQIARMGSWELDFATNIVVCSDEACRIYGLNPNQNQQSFENWLTFVHPEDIDFTSKKIKEARNSGHNFSFYHRIINKEGMVKQIYSESQMEFNSAGKAIFMYGIANDVTEIKLAEEKLIKSEHQIRNFATHLNKVLEEERAHLAREIHDELGQQLVGIKIGLSSFINKDKKNEITLREMMHTTDNTIQSLRKIATDLRPGILDSLGLVPSIQWLANEFERKTKIKCTSHLDIPEQKFDKDISTCFFRICQETLTNISKHSGASKVNIDIEQNKNKLTLKISDNGKGITNEKLENPFSMGLLGMRERANIIGADFNITSKKNVGTTILFEATV